MRKLIVVTKEILPAYGACYPVAQYDLEKNPLVTLRCVRNKHLGELSSPEYKPSEMFLYLSFKDGSTATFRADEYAVEFSN